MKNSNLAQRICQYERQVATEISNLPFHTVLIKGKVHLGKTHIANLLLEDSQNCVVVKGFPQEVREQFNAKIDALLSEIDLSHHVVIFDENLDYNLLKTVGKCQKIYIFVNTESNELNNRFEATYDLSQKFAEFFDVPLTGSTNLFDLLNADIPPVTKKKKAQQDEIDRKRYANFVTIKTGGVAQKHFLPQ